MSEFDKRIIEIVESYKAQDKVADSSQIFTNIENIDCFDFGNDKENLTKEIATKYSNDVFINKHPNQDITRLFESNDNLKILANMVQSVLVKFSCSYEYLKGQGYEDKYDRPKKFKALSELLKNVKSETEKVPNAHFLINDNLHNSVLDSLIELYESKNEALDGKTNLLAHDIVEHVFIAFDQLGIDTKHHRDGNIMKSPFAVFESICKDVFESYMKDEKHDYFDLTGWNQAIRSKNKLRKIT